MATVKTIYDLDLHESLKVKGVGVIIRVPGGWIYRFYDSGPSRYSDAEQTYVDGDEIVNSAFVPYSEEFIPVDVIQHPGGIEMRKRKVRQSINGKLAETPGGSTNEA